MSKNIPCFASCHFVRLLIRSFIKYIVGPCLGRFNFLRERSKWQLLRCRTKNDLAELKRSKQKFCCMTFRIYYFLNQYLSSFGVGTMNLRRKASPFFEMAYFRSFGNYRIYPVYKQLVRLHGPLLEASGMIWRKAF